jgi:hypothetical protein
VIFYDMESEVQVSRKQGCRKVFREKESETAVAGGWLYSHIVNFSRDERETFITGCDFSLIMHLCA